MIGLDQTRFGRSIHSVRVHLRGSYSPTPTTMSGQIEVTVGRKSSTTGPPTATAPLIAGSMSRIGSCSGGPVLL
ncbi:hypothetical protein BZL30_2842 [Mycobacterium kansasii]|uniref:Uncharacterized protein n=1 Tax=Mycobacterium kansasii TaxID=1768 RepID=A0A1V3XK95_MYCKA|nr:hypothetical protein BZL30_2842 [Mycobacterium kansasii]